MTKDKEWEADASGSGSEADDESLEDDAEEEEEAQTPSPARAKKVGKAKQRGGAKRTSALKAAKSLATVAEAGNWTGAVVPITAFFSVQAASVKAPTSSSTEVSPAKPESQQPERDPRTQNISSSLSEAGEKETVAILPDDPMAEACPPQPLQPPPPPPPPQQPALQAKPASSLVHFAKGKLVFKEKKLAFDRLPTTISDLNAFHKYKEECIAAGTLQSEFPTQFYPLLAKLVQDSESTLTTLVKTVKTLLFPDFDEDEDENENEEGDRETGADKKKQEEFLSDAIISKAIATISVRRNYGLEIDGSAITSCSIWRWEALDRTHLGDSRDRAEARISNREQAACDLVRVYRELPEEDRAALLGPKGKRKSLAASGAAPGIVVSAAAAFTPVCIETVTAPEQSPAQSWLLKSEQLVASGAREIVVGVPDEQVTASAAEVQDIGSSAAASTVGTPKSSSKNGGGATAKKDANKEKKEQEKKLREELKERKEQEKKEAKEAKEEAKRKKEEERVQQEQAKEEAKQTKREENRAKAEKVKEETKVKNNKGQTSLFNFIVRSKKEVSLAPAQLSGVDAALQSFRERFPLFHVKAGVQVARHNRFLHGISEDHAAQIAGQKCASDVVSDFSTFLKTESHAYRATSRSMHDDKMRIRKERYLNQQQLAAASFIGTSRTVDLTTMDTDTGCAPEMEEPLALEDPYVKYRLCRWKFLKFQEDYRPAYFGTWTKTSSVVGGKNPWAKDVVGGVLNYEVDSEAEWEEDEPGEELQSEDEDDDMGAGKGVEGDGHDGEEMDDWLVPDGYLSEDETDMHEADDSAPKATERSLKEVVKKKVGPLVPVVVSSFVEDDVPDAVLNSFKMAWMADVEQVDPFTYQSELALSNVVNMPYYKSGTNSSKSLAKALKANSEKHSFDESNLEALVQLVDGLSAPIGKLVDMAKERFPAVSKVQLEFKIRQVAVKEKRDGEDKAHWHIKDEFDYLTADEVMGADGSLKRKELAE